MNTCPNCGKIAGLHSSILQGCMCQYSTKALPQREWQGLTDEEINYAWRVGEANVGWDHFEMVAREIEAKLKEKNSTSVMNQQTSDKND